VPTLLMLTLALLIALLAMAMLDNIRARILIRVGIRLDRLLARRVMGAMVREANSPQGSARGQPLSDFDSFRQFITGSGGYTLLNAPWARIFILVIALLHPVLGLCALVFAAILLCLAVLNEYRVRGPLLEGGEASARNYAFTESSLRNSHVIEGMGMIGGLLDRWSPDRNRALAAQAVARDRGAGVSTTSRVFRT